MKERVGIIKVKMEKEDFWGVRSGEKAHREMIRRSEKDGGREEGERKEE